MALPIEDYALIGDSHTAALIGRDGSIDWLCFPRFDAGACFAALLGEPRHGRWLIAPDAPALSVHRQYRERTLILETTIETRGGAVRVIDYMPFLNRRRDVVRIVEGLRGRVTMRLELIIRFDYGAIVPWVHQVGDVLQATAGPHTLELMSPVAVRGENKTTVAEFVVGAGERLPFALSYRRSYEPHQPPIDPEKALVTTENAWRQWSERCTYEGRWRDTVVRSLITLKALVYAPTGGIVAAPTTSLPEQQGGVRNWDYRYCWLRDAAYTLNALLLTGYHDEATAWREWLLRAVAGCPEDLQILYSVTGERRLEEYECPWLPGYEGAAPVRVGNAASKQFQLDVYGEVMDTLHIARAVGLVPEPAAWRIQVALLNFLELNWRRPDAGIWEMRGPCRHFTHSKVMAWVAFDRGIKDARAFALDGPVERWEEIRAAIHEQICTEGYDAQANTFVQSYGSPHLDASLLLIPQVGFLPATDARVRGTVEAIERHLVVDGLVQRYSTVATLDGLPPREGTFLPCSFWLADCLVMIGRRADGEALFERLLALTNDVGLLAEEYNTRKRRMLGNFPQALTHMALINTACLLTLPAEEVQRVGTQGRCSVVTAFK